MTTALDKWPAAARLVALAAAGHYPQLLHHLKGHDLFDARGFSPNGSVP